MRVVKLCVAAAAAAWGVGAGSEIKKEFVLRTNNPRILRMLHEADFAHTDVDVTIERASETMAVYREDGEEIFTRTHAQLADGRFFGEFVTKHRALFEARHSVLTWHPGLELERDADILFLEAPHSKLLPSDFFDAKTETTVQTVRVFPNKRSDTLRADFGLAGIFKPVLVQVRDGKVAQVLEPQGSHP